MERNTRVRQKEFTQAAGAVYCLVGGAIPHRRLSLSESARTRRLRRYTSKRGQIVQAGRHPGVADHVTLPDGRR